MHRAVAGYGPFRDRARLPPARPRRNRPRRALSLQPPWGLAVRGGDLVPGAVLPRSPRDVRRDDPGRGPLVEQRGAPGFRVGDRRTTRPLRQRGGEARCADQSRSAAVEPCRSCSARARAMGRNGRDVLDPESPRRRVRRRRLPWADPWEARQRAARPRRTWPCPAGGDRLDARERRPEIEQERGRGCRLAASRIRDPPRRRGALAMVFLVFVPLYHYLPHHRPGWRAALLGAAVAALGTRPCNSGSAGTSPGLPTSPSFTAPRVRSSPSSFPFT